MKNGCWEKIVFVCVCLLCAAGFFLRLYGLGSADPWYDEIMTQDWSYQNLQAEASFTGEPVIRLMKEKAELDRHPTVYYLLIYFWSFLFGGSIFSLRMLSVISNTAAAVMLYRFSSIVLDKESALSALALFVFSPLQIWYAQEARVYALSTFLIILWMFCLLSTERVNSGKTAVCALCGLLAFSADYLAGFLVLALLANFFWERMRGTKVLKGFILGVSAFSALLLCGCLLKKSLGGISCFWWIPLPSWTAIPVTLINMVIGYNNFPLQYAICGAGLFFVGAAGAIVLFRKDKRKAALLATGILFPLAGVFFLSRSAVPVYLDRALYPVCFFWYLFLAAGLSFGKKTGPITWTARIAVFLLVAVSLARYYQGEMPTENRYFQYHLGARSRQNYNYSQGIRYLKREARSGDFIGAADEEADAIIRHYFRNYSRAEERPRYGPLFIPRYSPVLVWIIGRRDIKNGLNGEDPGIYYTSSPGRGAEVKSFSGAAKEFKRIWLVSYVIDKGWERKENSRHVSRELEKKHKKLLERRFGGLIIELFEMGT